MEEATALANGTSLSNVPKAREDWMLELPDIRKIPDMGLGARQFRTREKPEIGDRSVWTDTPADRERKKSTGAVRSSKGSDPAEERERERERKLIEKRDKEQEKMAKQHKKKQKRDKTLLEIHQDKLKKEKKDSTDGTRRPFNRDLDLQANRFDEAQKKAVMKKAQLLDTRFSSGSSKYL
ncbi:AGAP004241-PA-like protein [Anopheles sinensis]|uniref:AGAP004241-PA-like protein n=1 Tax=Anopheles sinensis TaxID=74873 RepID=A0A084VBH2_ANOSI|nr:AGAP004241-PA-like protein [Anopheles sinensis]